MSERLTLLPCPACGDQPVAYEIEDPRCVGFSCKCGLASPQSYETKGHPHSWNAAASAWNALPRALVWRKELPKEGGNYWWICEDESMDTPQMVNVIITDGRFHFYFHYSDGPLFHTCEKCQWAGHIPTPKEPTP